MIRLVLPSDELRSSWWDSVQEWGPGHIAGYSLFGFERDDLATDDGFHRWLEVQRRGEHTPPPGFVPGTTYWIVDDTDPATVLGGLSFRHELNEFLLHEGGHIGYGVRPSARGRGVATGALRASLEEATKRGLDRVLVTCDDDNIASARTIERCGGVLEDVRGKKRRYWIDLPN